jgi:hypothetical protein
MGIQELADLDVQRATWLNPSPPVWNPHYSYVEYLITYMDYADWSDRVAEGLLSEEEAAIIAELDKKVRNYNALNGDYDHEAILDDPKWVKIVRAARETQQRLLPLITDPAERIRLLEPSEHALTAAKRTL